MSRKTRFASATRRAPSAPPAPPPTVELAIPHPGPSTPAAGWRLPWVIARTHLARPLALLPVLLGVLVVFSLLRMSLSYMMAGVWFGATPPDPALGQVFNLLMWQIFGYFLAPAAFLPWFAARIHRAHAEPASWRLVAEPTRARWPQLLLLGLAWVVLAGLVLANAPRLIPAVGQTVALALVGLAWLACQVLMGVAAAAVWRDRLSAHRALVLALGSLARAWRAWPVTILAWGLQLVVAAGLLVGWWFMASIIPGSAGQEMEALKLVVHLLALPIVGVLLALWHHQHAALCLAVLEWGQLPPPADNPLL